MSPRHTKPLIRTGCALGALFAIAMAQVAAVAQPAPASSAVPAGSGSAVPAGSGSAARPAPTTAQKPTASPAAVASAAPAAVAQTAEPSTLAQRLTKQRQVVAELINRVQRLEGRHRLTQAQSQHRTDEINAASALLGSYGDRAAAITAARKNSPTSDALVRATQDENALALDLDKVETMLAAQSADVTAIEKATGWDLVETILEARCATAICFNNGSTKNWLGIEPLVELPVGKSFAIGHTSLSDWVNNHELHVDLAAGIRVWMFRDVVSFSMYLSKPLSDTPVRLEGSSFVYPGSSIRRPYPGAALGLLFDSIWIGFDRDELRNGDSQTNRDATGGSLNSAYPPNEVISSSWTVTVALQPVTAFRTAIGTAVQASKEGR